MDIQKLINDYTSWLRNEITLDKIGEYYEITTPYLDSSNDYLQIYVRQDGESIFFTDDGATIQNLKMCGFQFTPVRKELLQRTLRQYGVELNGNELTTKSQIKDFAQKKHLFIQAILRVDDMFITSKTKVSSFFIDDVQEFFNNKEIYYTENVQFTGKSGFAHNYDFLIQRTKLKPERLCQAVNAPSKSNVGNVLFAWNDTKPYRKDDSQLIVILNDQNNIVKGAEEAFSSYDVKIIRWSERNSPKNISLLSA